MLQTPAKDPSKVGGYIAKKAAALSYSSSSDSSDSDKKTSPRSSPVKKISGGSGGPSTRPPSSRPPSTGPLSLRALTLEASPSPSPNLGPIGRTVTLKVKAKEGAYSSTSREDEIVMNVAEPSRPRCLYVVHESSTNESRFVLNFK